MRRLLILALVMATLAIPAAAQTSFFTDRALQQVNVLTSPTPLTAAIPYGPVRVCSLPLTQASPCLPLATITDVNGNPISNSIGPLFGQLTTDATGRFTFGCTNNVTYQVQVTQAASNTPAVNYPITCPGGVGASVSANNAFIGTQSFVNLTASGAVLAKSFENTQYADQFSATDPCAGITSAVSALPASGGIVDATAYQGSFTCVAGVTLSSKQTTVKLGMGVTLSGPCPLFTITGDAEHISGSATGLFDLTGSQYGTKLVCTSGTNAIAVGTVGVGSPRVNAPILENISVNCNSQAASGLIFDVVQSAIVSNMQFSNCTAQGILLQVSNTAANVNNFSNRFESVSGSNDPIGIKLTNNATGLGGDTQNTFVNVNFNFTGTAGLDCGGGDNNRFLGLTLFRSSGTGNAIVMESPSASVDGCLFNYFSGVIGGNAGVSPILVKTGNYGSTVRGLDFVNGESIVTLQGTSELYVNDTLLCGTSCPSNSGSHPAAWLYWNSNQGNLGNPTQLTSGIALGGNFSNGGGEADIFMNFGGGNGTAGAYRFYRWDGTTATLFATLPFAQIGNIVGDTGTQSLSNKTINVPLTSGTGLQIFNTTTTCTTAASVGATCTTANISLPVAEADTSYRVTCVAKPTLTAVPVVIATTNASATQFTITIAALTAVAASAASYDCVAGHN